jgi:hypothetical protein
VTETESKEDSKPHAHSNSEPQRVASLVTLKSPVFPQWEVKEKDDSVVYPVDEHGFSIALVSGSTIMYS